MEDKYCIIKDIRLHKKTKIKEKNPKTKCLTVFAHIINYKFNAMKLTIHEVKKIINYTKNLLQ